MDLLKESGEDGEQILDIANLEKVQMGAGLTNFKQKSKFYPMLPAGNRIDIFHEPIIRDLDKMKKSFGKENLSKVERLALRRLELDDTVEIKPADKGGNSNNE